jgi:hypothetical protein
LLSFVRIDVPATECCSRPRTEIVRRGNVTQSQIFDFIHPNAYLATC